MVERALPFDSQPKHPRSPHKLPLPQATLLSQTPQAIAGAAGADLTAKMGAALRNKA